MMKRVLFIFFFIYPFVLCGQSKYLPTIAWRTEVKNVVMLTDSTYQVTVNPLNINEPGAAQRYKGNYLKDFVGHTYSIIDSTTTTIDVKDVFDTGVGPQSGRQGIVYKSVFGNSPYLAPIYYNHLDNSAFDYSRRIELAVLWEAAGAYPIDSANIVWWKDTISLIATKYDLDTLTVDFTEDDPLWVNDSADYAKKTWVYDQNFHQILSIDSVNDRVFSIGLSDGNTVKFQDTDTKYDLTNYTQFDDLDTLSFLRSIDLSPYMPYSDTTTLISTQKLLKDTAAAIRADFPEGGGSLWTAGTSGRIYYNSGVVGIGTAAPSTSYALHVAGRSIFQSNIIVQDGGVPLFETFGSNVYMPNLPKVATPNMLFYDPYSGTITYGDTVSGGGGALTFVGLSDTPSSYTGQEGNYVRVNSGATGLEFASGTGGTPWVSDANGINYTSGNVGIGASPSPSTFALGVAENSNTFAVSILNSNAAGDGIRVGTSGTTETDRILDAYSMTGDVLSARADGSVYAPNIGSAKKANVLFYDISNGLITYGDTTDFGGSGGTGGVSSVSSATTNQLTVANGTTTPSLSIVTGAVADGGTSLATGNQIHDFVTGLGYITGNQSITFSGNITGSGTTAITTTIANGAVEASMLNNNIISGKTELASGLASTDELMVSDAGTVKRMDVSVLQSYMQDNLTFGGGGEVTQLSDLSDVNTSTPTNKNVLIADGTDWESRALTKSDISDFGTYDNYAKWVLNVDGTLAEWVTSGYTLNLAAGTGMSLDFDDGTNTIEFSSSGGGASQLSDLSDVNTSTPTNKNVLIADGTDWESRAFVISDISDLTIPASVTGYPMMFFSNSNKNFAASNLTVNTTNGALTNTTSEGAPALTLINSNNIGAPALFLRGGANTSNITQFNDRNNNPRFAFRGDGAMFAPNLTKGTTDTILYWDHVDGEIRRGLAGTGGGTTTPGGSTGDIQYNNAGSFSGFGVFDGSKFELDDGDRFQAYGSTQLYPYAKVTPAGIGWGDTDNATIDIGLVYDDEDEIFTTVGGFKPLNIIDEDMQYGQTGYVLKKTATGLKWSAESGGMTYPASSGIVTYNSGTGTWAASITNNSANWNTAYSWGDHSTEGYLTQVDTTSTDINRANWLTFLGNNVAGGTGLELPSGYGILTANNGVWGPVLTDNSSNWNTAYNDKINSASFATGTGVLTLTQQDAGTVTVDLDGRFLTQVDTTSTNIIDANWKAYIANHSTGGSSLWTEDLNGITYAGNVGINGASASGYNLNVTGTIKASTDIYGRNMVASGYISAGSSITSNHSTPSFILNDSDNDKYTTLSYQSSSNKFSINRDNTPIFESQPGAVMVGYTGDVVLVSTLSSTRQINVVDIIPDKTANFSVDAASGDIHSLKLTSTGAITITINNLVAGSQGTIFIYNASATSGFTVVCNSGNGTGNLDEIEMGNKTPASGKFTSITYTATGQDENGNSINEVILVYGQGL